MRKQPTGGPASAPWLKGPYIGTDILPELLDHARQLCERADWLFVPTEGQFVPAPYASADFVCFFSVLTHISHEESWEYIRESKRVLKPGGKLGLFLPRISHPEPLGDLRAGPPATKRRTRSSTSSWAGDALLAFAYNAGLKVDAFLDGDQSNIPIENDLIFENGTRMSGLGRLG